MMHDPQRWVGRYFRLHEATRSSRAARLGIINQPGEKELAAIDWVAQRLLDPIREHFGPIRISSWLRVPALNDLTPGASTTSAHRWGGAADFTVMDHRPSLAQVMEWIVSSDIPYDQVILEYSAWIHVGAPADLNTLHARRERLMKFAGSDYEPYDHLDPRVIGK